MVERGSRDFEDFYQAERARLLRAMAFALGDADLGAEVTDEAMARAYERWGDVGDMANPSGWVYRVALNLGYNRTRRRALERRRPVPTDRDRPDVEGVADPAVARALAALPVDQRAVIVLRFHLDWSVDGHRRGPRVQARHREEPAAPRVAAAGEDAGGAAMSPPTDLPLEDRLRAHFADRARTMEIPGPSPTRRWPGRGRACRSRSCRATSSPLAGRRRARPLLAAAAVLAVVALVAGSGAGPPRRPGRRQHRPDPATADRTDDRARGAGHHGDDSRHDHVDQPAGPAAGGRSRRARSSVPTAYSGRGTAPRGSSGTWTPPHRPPASTRSSPSTRRSGPPPVRRPRDASWRRARSSTWASNGVAAVDWLGVGIVAGPAELQPRPVEVLDPAAEVYRAAAAEVGASLGSARRSPG